MTKNKHAGSDFEDFLREEGILEEVDAYVQKRIIAEQIRAVMREQSISEAALARVMGTSRSAVRNILDPENDSATLLSLTRAAKAIGRELRVELVMPPKHAKPKRAARISRAR